MALASASRILTTHLRPTLRVFTKCVSLTKPQYSNATLSRCIATSSSLFSDRKFSKNHEWVLPTGDDHATIGITEYAQEKLGDIVFIELPDLDTTLSKEETFGVVESVKAASDVMTPVSGEVTETNSALEENPEIVNKDPYGEGWLIKMKLSEPSELDDLLSEEDYTKFLEDCD